jgi:hypothetical protein
MRSGLGAALDGVAGAHNGVHVNAQSNATTMHCEAINCAHDGGKCKSLATRGDLTSCLLNNKYFSKFRACQRSDVIVYNRLPGAYVLGCNPVANRKEITGWHKRTGY